MEPPNKTQSSYDAIAAEYARRIKDELAHKPFDRQMLEWLIEKVGGRGPIADLGCGPGHIAAYLDSRGALAMGIDLSPAMIAQAQKLYPGITFRQGDMLALPLEDASLGGIAAFYSIIHIDPDTIPRALREMRRVLKPGGTVLMAFHVGHEVRHVDNMWDIPVDVDFIFYQSSFMAQRLQEAGFILDERIERSPYAEGVEAQTRRAYLFAHKEETA
jgi:ubiquinone/menaquinone biosynthesis C-methylase UbiE